MNRDSKWTRMVVVFGAVAFLGGIIVPLEGAFVVLLGSFALAMGTQLRNTNRRSTRLWWMVTFAIAFGFATMVVLTEMGGVGEVSGISAWWLLLVLPYPVGWLVGLFSLIRRSLRYFRSHRGEPVGAH